MTTSFDPSAAEPPRTAGQRLTDFGLALRAGVERLFRPVRPLASPDLRIFPGWPERFAAAALALAAVLAGMAYVDPYVVGVRAWTRGGWAYAWELVTDVGKSAWVLIPSGVLLLVILAVVTPARRFADRVMLALAARLAFVFIAVGGSGLIVTIVKRIIARGRPRYFDEFGALHFQFPTWQASYASFPSGHSQTAFAIALSFAALFPRFRNTFIVLAVIVAFSRVAVDAHYFTDIVAGSLWGAWFTVMTRDWFARRGLVFSPMPHRQPVPMPWHRLKQALTQVGRCLRG